MRRKALAIRFINLIYKLTIRLYIHVGLFIVTNLWGRGRGDLNQDSLRLRSGYGMGGWTKIITY